MSGTLTGGLRDRMLVQSIREQITDELTTLGWMAGGRNHSPLVLITGFPTDQGEVEPNTVAFSMDTGAGRDLELGSNAEQHEMVMFVDMFMEDDSVGLELSGDVYAFLKKNRALNVYDYENAKVVDFRVDIERVDRKKPVRATQAWQKYWHIVSFSAVDTRTNA